MGWLQDDVALVTGGGSGLGRAIVERFLDEGARVGVLEIHPGKAAALREDFGGMVCVTEGDVTSYADNERAVQETVRAFGKLDTLIGNTGLWDFSVSLADLPALELSDAFDQIFGPNVKGYVLGAKAALPALRESRGSMIFTVSNAGMWPGGGGPLYTASKHAVVGLVKQLAYELCPEVRVNGVSPGGMRTDLRGPSALGQQDVSMEGVPIEELMEQHTPLEIQVRPEDYTGHYVLLASRANARTATGSVHNCDGGVGIAGRKTAETLRAMAEGAGNESGPTADAGSRGDPMP